MLDFLIKAMDIYTIAIHELANISERRIERLVHPDTIIYSYKKKAIV